MSRPVVVAGGGVLWRGEPAAPEVALIHRPRYDDWSLPKGKAKRDEYVLEAALREVAEETGSLPQIGPRLLTTRYRVQVRGRPADKVVTYWSMQHRAGEFVESDEVDALEWLPVRAARRRLSKRADVAVLQAFARVPRGTRPLVLLRSGPTTAARSSGRSVQVLSRRGRDHAQRLVPLLEELGVDALRSADDAASTGTLRPYGRGAGLTLHVDARLRRAAYPQHRRALLDEIRAETEQATPAVCVPRAVLEDLVGALGRGAPVRAPRDRSLRKGGWWLLHMRDGRVQAFERHELDA